MLQRRHGSWPVRGPRTTDGAKESPKRCKRRHSVSSPSSSVERLLRRVDIGSDEGLMQQLQEARRRNWDAPDIFRRMRQAGLTPLQVGKIAAELQILALAAESKSGTEASEAGRDTGEKARGSENVSPHAQSMPLSEVLSMAVGVTPQHHDLVTGSNERSMEGEGPKVKLDREREQVERLADSFSFDKEEGKQRETEVWEFLNSILSTLPMSKRWNEVEIEEFGATKVQGKQAADADGRYLKVAKKLQEFF
eukprot:1532145-Amphidinium_carterae.5